MRLLRRALAFSLALAFASACSTEEKSRSTGAVKQQVLSRLQAADVPTIILPEEERNRWNDLTRPGRRIAGLETIMECGRGRDRYDKVLPRVAALGGGLAMPQAPTLGPQEVAYQFLVNEGLIHYGQIDLTNQWESRIYNCQLNSDSLSGWLSSHPEIVTSGDGFGIQIARRSDIRYDFENSYETAVPMEGETTMVSVRFNYALQPTLSQFSVTQRGTGTAQAFLSNSSGQWTFTDFQFQDPAIEYSGRFIERAPVAPQERAP